MRDRKRPVGLLVLCAVVAACLLAPGAADASTSPPSSPSATFMFPVAKTTSYGTTDGWSVSWEATGNFASQRLIEVVAPVNRDGGCKSVSYQRRVVHDGAASPLGLTGSAGHCYRYRLDLLGNDGGVLASRTSGALRSLPGWTGREDLFRRGEFSTQRTWTWCVAASVQIMLNEIRGRQDRSYANQRIYERYARLHDRHAGLNYSGSDATGWAAALNHFNGGSGYRVHADGTFLRAIHDAALRLRLTGHPVGLLVKHGNHAWVMSGFRATADPALTSDFTVTAVYIEGPLFPKQQANGYDMAPDTRLSLTRLRLFFRRYSDRHPGTTWDRRFVTVQP